MAQLLILVRKVSPQAWWHQLLLPHYLLLYGPLPCMGSRSCGVCGVAVMPLLAVPHTALGSASSAGAVGAGTCVSGCAQGPGGPGSVHGGLW